MVDLLWRPFELKHINFEDMIRKLTCDVRDRRGKVGISNKANDTLNLYFMSQVLSISGV